MNSHLQGRLLNPSKRVVNFLEAFNQHNPLTLEQHAANIIKLTDTATNWSLPVKETMFDLHQYLSATGILKYIFGLEFKDHKTKTRFVFSFDRVQFDTGARMAFLPQGRYLTDEQVKSLLELITGNDTYRIRTCVDGSFRRPARMPYYEG